MKVMLDTSVLVAAMLSDHVHHDASARCLSLVLDEGIEFAVSAHTLVEVYAVLTRLPRTPRISPADAHRLIQHNILTSACVVALTGEDYAALLDHLVRAGIRGGATYDALIAKAAELAKVDLLVTQNVAHFQRVWPEQVDRVTLPENVRVPNG